MEWYRFIEQENIGPITKLKNLRAQKSESSKSSEGKDYYSDKDEKKCLIKKVKKKYICEYTRMKCSAESNIR